MKKEYVKPESREIEMGEVFLFTGSDTPRVRMQENNYADEDSDIL